MITWGYVAGCVDCDGWITFSFYNTKFLKSERTYTIGITQHIKHEKGMKKISSFLKKHGINHSLIHRRVPWKYTNKSEGVVYDNKMKTGQVHMVDIRVRERKSSILLLSKIKNYMAFKKKLAEEAILHISDRERRWRKSKDLEKTFRKKRYWEEDETARLKKLVEEGYNNVAIALLLNRSRDSVSHKIYRLRINRW